MNGVGRLGGIIGPIIGGIILRQNIGLGAAFALLAIPTIIPSVALLMKGIFSYRRYRSNFEAKIF